MTMVLFNGIFKILENLRRNGVYQLRRFNGSAGIDQLIDPCRFKMKLKKYVLHLIFSRTSNSRAASFNSVSAANTAFCNCLISD